MTSALEGIRILDFSQMMMGPWATQLLGDLGAEIIKVERPGIGEWERGLETMGRLLQGDSPFFLAMNRNKRSLSLNLKDPQARDIVDALIARSDIVVENFRPGVMDRLGFGYDRLSDVNPRLIYCSGSGYGSSGPYVHRPGQDLLIQALSGLAAHGGRAGDPPTPAGTAVCDAMASMMLACGILAALQARTVTGRGQKVEVDLLSTAIAAQCQEAVAYLNGMPRWERSEAGIAQAWLGAPYGIYATSDGYLALAMNSLRTLGELLDLPQLAAFENDPQRAYTERDQIKDTLEEQLRTRSSAEWMDLLGTRDVWCSEVKDFDGVFSDPHVLARELVTEVEHPRIGPLKLIRTPISMSDTPATIRRAPPLVGEHTAEILRELGYDDQAVAELCESGVC
jgi:crotonobetainyl-CoA:carnitine CoA-transferase CaiB-like acyl-CoA transferase